MADTHQCRQRHCGAIHRMQQTGCTVADCGIAVQRSSDHSGCIRGIGSKRMRYVGSGVAHSALTAEGSPSSSPSPLGESALFGSLLIWPSGIVEQSSHLALWYSPRKVAGYSTGTLMTRLLRLLARTQGQHASVRVHTAVGRPVRARQCLLQSPGQDPAELSESACFWHRSRRWLPLWGTW